MEKNQYILRVKEEWTKQQITGIENQMVCQFKNIGMMEKLRFIVNFLKED